YKDVRPWVRSIKNRIVRREMPPWHIEKNVGVQHFKYDPSLSDKEIGTIAAWVDSGALEGNPKDAPPARVVTDEDRRTIGKPGLKVRANSKTSFNMHYHSIGEELTDRTSVAFKFYPKGYVPPRQLLRTKAGSTYMDLGIPAGQVSRTDGYTTLRQPTVLLSFQ